MAARSPFSVKVKNSYADGILFFTGTQNKFNLSELFDYTFEPGLNMFIGPNTSINFDVFNTPQNFQKNNDDTCDYNNPTLTTGHEMHVKITAAQYSYPTGSDPILLKKFTVFTKLKIIVQASPF